MSLAEIDGRLRDGRAALVAGDWAGPRAAFEAALAVEEFPEALDGLGRALWWLRESDEAVVYRRACVFGLPPRRGAGAGGADRALALA